MGDRWFKSKADGERSPEVSESSSAAVTPRSRSPGHLPTYARGRHVPEVRDAGTEVPTLPSLAELLALGGPSHGRPRGPNQPDGQNERPPFSATGLPSPRIPSPNSQYASHRRPLLPEQQYQHHQPSQYNPPASWTPMATSDVDAKRPRLPSPTNWSSDRERSLPSLPLHEAGPSRSPALNHQPPVDSYKDDRRTSGDPSGSDSGGSVGQEGTANREGDGSICSNCQTRTTPLWRRDGKGGLLCNACGLFAKVKGRPRPASLKTDVIKPRARRTRTQKHAQSDYHGGPMSYGPIQHGYYDHMQGSAYGEASRLPHPQYAHVHTLDREGQPASYDRRYDAYVFQSPDRRETQPAAYRPEHPAYHSEGREPDRAAGSVHYSPYQRPSRLSPAPYRPQSLASSSVPDIRYAYTSERRQGPESTPRPIASPSYSRPPTHHSYPETNSPHHYYHTLPEQRDGRSRERELYGRSDGSDREYQAEWAARERDRVEWEAQQRDLPK